jgi:hypothetical protein
MHPLSVGRSCQLRGPDALELGFAGLTVTAVTLLALSFAVRLTHMVEVLDAVSVVSGAQTDAVVHRAVHGRWPAPGDVGVVSPDADGFYTQHLTLGDGGVVTADLRLGRAVLNADGLGLHVEGGVRGRLSFRPVLFGAEDAPTLTYLCGYARPPAGAVAAPAADRTTLPRNLLPPFCR